MILFKYIEDKDVFQTFYTTKLSKRLIHGVSASDEAEASMIAKLKEACGFEYTNKLQRMFTDMSLSKDLTDSFKEKMAQTHDEAELDINFSVMVLGTNFWPLQAPTDKFTIPKDILPTYERFTRYYGQKHQYDFFVSSPSPVTQAAFVGGESSLGCGITPKMSSGRAT